MFEGNISGRAYYQMIKKKGGGQINRKTDSIQFYS